MFYGSWPGHHSARLAGQDSHGARPPLRRHSGWSKSRWPPSRTGGSGSISISCRRRAR